MGRCRCIGYDAVTGGLLRVSIGAVALMMTVTVERVMR